MRQNRIYGPEQACAMFTPSEEFPFETALMTRKRRPLREADADSGEATGGGHTLTGQAVSPDCTRASLCHKELRQWARLLRGEE